MSNDTLARSATPAAGQRQQLRGPDRQNGQIGSDPHLGLRFWIELNGLEIAGFTECSGFSIETTVEEYPEGGLNTYTHKLPVRTKYGNITLKRGLDVGQDFYRWYKQTIDGQSQRRPLSIILYETGIRGSERQPAYRWDFRDAYPVKWTGPDLNADSHHAAIESVEIAHHGLLPTSGRVTAR